MERSLNLRQSDPGKSVLRTRPCARMFQLTRRTFCRFDLPSGRDFKSMTEAQSRGTKRMFPCSSRCPLGILPLAAMAAASSASLAAFWAASLSFLAARSRRLASISSGDGRFFCLAFLAGTVPVAADSVIVDRAAGMLPMVVVLLVKQRLMMIAPLQRWRG